MRNQKEVKEWSENNKPITGICPILAYRAERWTVDHCHFDLYVRGVISQPANTLEGYITKYFLKYCANYTDLSLPDVLRNLADYLEAPYWLENKLHYRGIDDMRKFLERCSKTTIVKRLKDDFNIELSEGDFTQEELIVEYLKSFIQECEDLP